MLCRTFVICYLVIIFDISLQYIAFAKSGIGVHQLHMTQIIYLRIHWQNTHDVLVKLNIKRVVSFYMETLLYTNTLIFLILTFV